MKKIITWTVLQTIPAITFNSDNNDNNTRIITGVRWNVTPVNFSFNANEYVSPVQFFIVNPVRRLGGSVELFVQPEYTLANYNYSNLKRFSFTTGTRLFIPLEETGENLAVSIGGKYSLRQTKESSENNTSGIELGLYTFFGILGVKFDYNFNKNNRYNISLNFKYF
jgi:hypothetical protein